MEDLNIEYQYPDVNGIARRLTEMAITRSANGRLKDGIGSSAEGIVGLYDACWKAVREADEHAEDAIGLLALHTQLNEHGAEQFVDLFNDIVSELKEL